MSNQEAKILELGASILQNFHSLIEGKEEDGWQELCDIEEGVTIHKFCSDSSLCLRARAEVEMSFNEAAPFLFTRLDQETPYHRVNSPPYSMLLK